MIARSSLLPRALTGAVLAASSLVPLGPAAGDEPALPEAWTDAFRWRSIGPANMGGRITAIAVYDADPSTWWAASASGGLLKTVNNGVTFEHQFDREATVSIGDVEVAPSDPSIVWVGTGESNPRNSVSWGNGVYKSTDGGATWTHKGLDGSFQTGRIVIHPEQPDVVYVGALGRLWGPNEERGLYKTTDGGETWEKVHYVDENTGVIDVAMHPGDPETLLVATYERQRDGFDSNDPAKKWGPGSGVWKTTDGGTTWNRITEGLPSGELGRIGLDYYRADPNIVYMVLESDRIGKQPENAPYIGASGEDADVGARLTQIEDEGPAAQAGLEQGDIVVRVEEEIIHGYRDLLRAVRRHVAGETVQMEVSRDRKSVEIEITFAKMPGSEEDEEAEEGEGPPRRRGAGRSPFQGGLGGQNENMQEEQGPDGHEYGGIFRSEDGGDTWQRINSLNPRPMYYSQVRVDPSDDSRVYVLGTSLYRSSDGGETFTGDGGGRGVHVDHHAMWIDPSDGRHMILGNDGGIYVTYDRMGNWDHHNHVAIGQFYHVGVDSRRDYRAYGGLQDNGSWGGPTRSRSGGGPTNSDWISIGGGDGFICLVDPDDPDLVYSESQNGSLGRYNLRSGDRGFMRPRPPRGERYRFNWKTPYLLSHVNPKIYYAAGNHVFRSLDRGEGLKAISPEITRTDEGSATALAQSPLDPEVLYVGTDDGALWMTSDDGHTWIDLFDPEATAEPAPDREGGAAPGRRGGPGGGQGRGPGGRRGGGGGPFDAERLRGMLDRFDENDDGKLTSDELPERMARMMERLDRNGDGAIDEKDIGAAGPETGEAAAEAPAGATEAETEAEPATAEPATAESGPAGRWRGRITRETARAEESAFVLEIEVRADGTVHGDLESSVLAGTSVEGTFDEAVGALRLVFRTEAGRTILEATIAGDAMEGRITAGGGFFVLPFEARRTATDETPPEAPGAPPGAETDAEAEPPPFTGEWSGTISATGSQIDQSDVTLILRLDEAGKISGTVTTPFGDNEIVDGSFDAERGRLVFTTTADQFDVSFTMTVTEDTMRGNAVVGEGFFEFAITARRVAGAAADEEEAGPRYDWKTIGELIPDPRWVSGLEASRYEAGRVYLTLDGHRSNDDEPYVFVSEDFGRRWRPIRANLPTSAGSTRTIREDIVNPEVLYLGAEFGIWVSIDRGASWTRFNNNLPTVAVHEIAQHPTAGEIVAGTHGRSLWIVDVTPLRQATAAARDEPAVLFTPKSAIHWRSEPSRGRTTRRFVGENPPEGVEIFYALGRNARAVRLEITDAEGERVYEFEDPSSEAGLHRVAWNLRERPQRGQGQRGRFRRGRLLPAGTYHVLLVVDGTKHRARFEVTGDPAFPDYRPWETQERDEAFEAFFGGG